MSQLDASLDPPRAERPAAFRRPGLIAAYAVYLLVAGFAVAAPWSSLLHATVAGYPRGDAELFDRGGTMLIEAIRLTRFGSPPATTSSLLAILFTGAVGLLPFAALIAGLGRKGRVRAPFLASRAVRPIGTLTLLWGLSFAVEAIFGALLGVLGVKLVGALHFAARGEALGHVVLGAVVLLLLLPIGVARDLAMVSAVNDETRFYTSSSRGLRVVRRAFGRAVGGYLVRALLALGILLGALFLPSLLSTPDAPPATAMPFALHQLAIVLVVALRASWLASAIRLLDTRAPLPTVEAPVVFVAPADPIAPAELTEPVKTLDEPEPLAPADPIAPAEIIEPVKTLDEPEPLAPADPID
ncbi:MAG: hypothetical protein ABJE95_32140 [Byssovorax sp.]